MSIARDRARGSLLTVDDEIDSLVAAPAGALIPYSSMRAFRFGPWRRVTAVLVAIVLGLWNAETLVADVHDAEASAAIGAVPSDATSPTDATHSVHVCHCQHAHCALTSASASMALRAEVHPELNPTVQSLIPAASPQTLFRPPIS